MWRFARYYRGDPEYRRKGPPPVILRLLGPFVVVLSVAVLGTGIALLLLPASQGSTWLFLHKATFVLWFGAMAIHVLGPPSRHGPAGTGRLLAPDPRGQVRGAGALGNGSWSASVVAGILLAAVVAPHIGSWHLAGFGQ